MPTNRNHLKCTVCGTKTITRVSLVYGPYREFAFACPGCAIEIRLGVDVIVPSEEEIKGWSEKNRLPVDFFAPEPKYTLLINGEWLNYANETELMEDEEKIKSVEILDDTFLVKIPKQRHLSPFILAFQLMGETVKEFQTADHIRRKTASNVWPALEQLILHYERKQWALFDNQFRRVFQSRSPDAISDKTRSLFQGIENYGLVFCKNDDVHLLIKDRIRQAESRSRSEVRRLVDYYQSRKKDLALIAQLNGIRRRWARLFSALAALYTTHYWKASKYQIEGFTLAQKRFDELKNLYVDSFETFCRISVIAAGVEGILSVGRAVVPKRNGEFSLEQFDVFKNGSKSDILRRLGPPVADLFAPYIDHRLRNGIGHNSATYNVVTDEVSYVIESETGITAHTVPYISFCESMFKLYLQLEAVSPYVNWVRLYYVPEDAGKSIVSISS